MTTVLLLAYTNQDGTISGGNLTWTHSGNSSAGGAVADHMIDASVSQKLYFEFTQVAKSTSADCAIGFFGCQNTYSAIISNAVNSAVFFENGGNLWANGSSQGSSGVTSTVGHTYGVLIDTGAHTFQVNDITAAVTGTQRSGVPTSGKMAPGVTDDSSSTPAEITFNFGATTFAASIPSGYTAYNLGTLAQTVFGVNGVLATTEAADITAALGFPNFNNVTLQNPFNSTLSNKNLTWTHASNTTDGGASGDYAVNSGAVYFEVTVNTASSGSDFSFGVDGAGIGAPAGAVLVGSNGHMIINGTDVGASGVTVTSGHTYGFLLNVGAGHIQVNDITASVTGTQFSLPAGNYIAGCLDNASTPAVLTFNFGGSTFAGSLPGGYVSWNSFAGAALFPGVDAAAGLEIVDDYFHIFSQDDRTAFGTGFYVGTTASSSFTQFSAWDSAFTQGTTAGPDYTGTPAAGDNFAFQFKEAVACTGFQFQGGDLTNRGTWAIDGSNDGAAWSTLVPSFTWNITSTGIDGAFAGQEVTWTNATKYFFYRLRYVSGNFNNGGRLCVRLFMRMRHAIVGGGPRSESPAIVTATCVGSTLLPTTGHNSDTNSLVDGLYWNTLPVAASTAFNFTAPTANDAFQFNFHGVEVSILRWVLDIGTNQLSQTSYGTWQWFGSNDGVTFTASGSSFTLAGNASLNTILYSTQVPSPTDAFSYWQLRYLSGTTHQLNGIVEITFDLNIAPSSIVAVVEAPDMFAAIGYPGSGADFGSLVTTEPPDTFAAVGVVPPSGAFHTTEAPDIFSAFGRQPLTGVLHVTEATDKFSAAGVGRGENGVFITTEAVDIFTAVGHTPVVGTFVTSEAPDRFFALGAGAVRVRRRRMFFTT